MAPSVPELRHKLGYPLYAADFDPLNQDFLLVGGGGGGSTPSGIPNKITLIDTSRRDALHEIADIELAKDEDSVTTLSVASSSETALTAIAGINSSATDQDAGKNEHLRTFRIPLPRKRKADGSEVETSKSPPPGITTQALGRTALFKSAVGPKNDTYQRVLRACPVQSANEARIAVIASGLAPQNEIISFQPVANTRTGTVDEISRIHLGQTEAADVDVYPTKDSGQILAYCTDTEVFVQQLHGTKEKPIEHPNCIYRAPVSVDPASGRAKFRALRLLSPKHILLLQNKPGRSGVLLEILRIDQFYNSGRITLQKRLKSSMKSAVGLDVCGLSESQPGGDRQIIIAVAGQDSSIEVLTIDYDTTAGMTKFRPYTILRNVHTGPITKICFANFIGPPLPVDKNVRPQSVRLASVGVDQVVVVHTFHLRPYPAVYSKTPRYLLIKPGPSEGVQNSISVLVGLLVMTIVGLLLQAFCEVRGVVEPSIGAVDWLPQNIQNFMAQPFGPTVATTPLAVSDIPGLSTAIEKIKEAPSIIPVKIEGVVEEIEGHLKDIVMEQSQLETPKAIVMRDNGPGAADGLSAELHHDAELIKDDTLKKWDDLSDKQKRGWKKKLRDAGHWAENQGESILKGILFSELAGLVA